MIFNRCSLVFAPGFLFVLGCGGGQPAPVVALQTPVVAQPTATAPTDIAVVKAPAPAVAAQRPFTDFPKAPAVQAVDAELPFRGFLFLGANATHAWMTSVSDERHTAVVDLGTGCATESYRDPKVIAELRRAQNTRTPESVETFLSTLSSKEGRAELRGVVGQGLRFGMKRHRFPTISYSASGQHIFIPVGGSVLYSADGGQKYDMLARGVGEVLLTDDDRLAVFARDTGELVTFALDRNVHDVPLETDKTRRERKLASIGSRTLRGLSPDGHAMVERDEATKKCIDFYSLETGKVDRAVCAALPSPTADPKPSWERFSPGKAFGAISWSEQKRKRLTFVLAIVDMSDGRVVKTVDDMQILGWDDKGTVVLSSMSEGGGDHTYVESPGQPRRPLGNFIIHDFDPATRRAIADNAGPTTPKGKLGPQKCKIAKAITVP